MRVFTLILVLLISGFMSVTDIAADDNVAACEIVIFAPVMDPDADAPVTDVTDPQPMIATFLPADDFVFSVFDGEPGHLEQVDGKKIRALMCIRANVLPTEFDSRFIRTGIPLHLSQNFDSPDSALLSIRRQDGKYTHQYSGPDLNAADMNVLETYLENLNAIPKE